MEYLPKGFYLETSVLTSLPIDVMNAELERLNELAKAFNAQVLIPEVCFREWVRKRKTSVSKHISNAENGLWNLSRLFDYISSADWEKEKKGIIEDTEDVTRKIVESHGIKIVPTPDIDLQTLLDMSLDNVKPFEESHEKGFRDAVILFTVLEHAKGTEERSTVLVAKDKGYRSESVKQLAEEYGVELEILESISECISQMEVLLKSLKQWVDEYRESNLKAFLLENIKQISQFIKEQGTFTKSFLNKNNELGFLPDIEKVEDVNAIDILSATRAPLPEGTTEGRVKISFVANTKFDVTISEYVPDPEPEIKVGQDVVKDNVAVAAYVGLLGGIEPIPNRRTVTRSIQQPVTLSGSVVLKKRSGKIQDVLSELVLEDVVTATEGLRYGG